ncbi:PaaI family thioesterase [Candidatus Corynebacterium faecigallinarum]|uniref:PaaI family thioesterase n=1 Tax=Candidatus Corynebacterium faecigallinarum TaxID=2838528 RepID=UPI003FB8C407
MANSEAQPEYTEEQKKAYQAEKATVMARMTELLSKAGAGEISEEESSELATIFETKVGGLDALLGLKYIAFAPEVVLELEVTGDHVQPWGITNGGTYAALGESAGSFAGFIASGGKGVMGTTNSTNFLRPSGPGDVIRTTAHAVHTGRTSQLWRIEHTSAKSGKLLATTELRTVVRND